jgi:hypothetical protein
MKKQILSLTALALLAGAVTLTGCKKDDTTAPIITLKGDAAKKIVTGTSYTDEGATAEDDRDGDISSKITVGGSVDKTTAAKYTLTYDVADEAGNAATQVSRVVTVYHDNTVLGGKTYNVSENCTASGTGSYTSTVIAKSGSTDKIEMGNFGSSGSTFTATISGDLGTVIALDAATNSGIAYTDGGSGSITGTANSFTITYTQSISGNSQTCTSVFTKQ